MTAPELQQRLIERLRNPSVRVALGGALNLGLSAEAEAFVALPEPQAADLLCALHAHQPEALQLLLVSLKQPEWAARAVGAALRAADYAAMVAEFQAWMEDLLRAALPLLDLPLRAAVLHLYPGRRVGSVRAGELRGGLPLLRGCVRARDLRVEQRRVGPLLRRRRRALLRIVGRVRRRQRRVGVRRVGRLLGGRGV
jgi:hypothetical protein